jgi:hypothetical protein
MGDKEICGMEYAVGFTKSVGEDIQRDLEDVHEDWRWERQRDSCGDLEEIQGDYGELKKEDVGRSESFTVDTT